MAAQKRTTTTTDEYLVEMAIQAVLDVARMPQELRELLYEAALIEKQRHELVEQRLAQQERK